MIELVTRIIDKVAPLVCEDCGTKLVTLEEDVTGITIGCPKCNPEYGLSEESS